MSEERTSVQDRATALRGERGVAFERVATPAQRGTAEERASADYGSDPATGLLAHRNAALLQQASSLLRNLDDDAYTRGRRSPRAGAVGGHVRHVIDFYDCFLTGLRSRCIDYDARSRDSRTETDRRVAVARLADLVRRLQRLASFAPGEALRVKMDVPGADETPWGDSSLARELQFLLSHTVHHFALIRLLLERAGIETPASFGVAPSTLAHLAERGPLLQ